MAYDSAKHAFSWGGVAAKGLADGEAITWTFPNQEVSSYVGVRGEGSNVLSPDKRCEIQVILQSDSPTNAQWYAMYSANFEGPALLRDRSSTAVAAFAELAMVTKQPDVSRSRDKPTTTWNFTAPRGTATPLTG